MSNSGRNAIVLRTVDQLSIVGPTSFKTTERRVPDLSYFHYDVVEIAEGTQEGEEFPEGSDRV